MPPGEKLHGLVICMFIYDLGGKILVLVVPLAMCGPRKVIIAMVFCSTTCKTGTYQ